MGYSRHQNRSLFSLKDVQSALGCPDEAKLRRLIAVLFFYTGDYQRGSKVLSTLLTPIKTYQQTMHLQNVFRILLLSSVLKESITMYEVLKTSLKDFDIKSVKNIKLLLSTTERLNIVHAIKLCMSMIKHHFY